MPTPDQDPAIFELPPGEAPPWRVRSVLLPREGIFWLLAAAVMMVTGLFKGINLLVLLAYLLVGLWIINLRLVGRDLERLRGRRRLPDALFAGKPADFEIVASVEGRGARGVTIVESGESHSQRWLVLRLFPGQAVRLRYSLTLEKRGRYSAGPLQAQSQFPFGLVGRVVALAPAAEWVVLPRLGRLDIAAMRHWLARAARGDGRARLRRPVPATLESDIHGLREFRPGDSPRWIHWRSSARRNQVLVREFEQNTPPRLTLYVEPWLPAGATDADRTRLDRVLSMAATVCYEWGRDPNATLGVVVLGAEAAAFGPGNGWDLSRRVLEWLAVQEGAAFPADPSDQARHLRGGAPALVLSSRPDSSLPETIAELSGRAAAVAPCDGKVPWYDCPSALE